MTRRRPSTRASLLLAVALLAGLYGNTANGEAQCHQDDFKFEYTSCNDRGERWQVAVPRAHTLTCDRDAPLPRPGLPCSFTCSPGKYLDLETQSCRPCTAGSFSLGGGRRFEDFVALPSGWSIDNEEVQQPWNSGLSGDRAADSGCPPSVDAGWKVRNGELQWTNTPCSSSVSYSVQLVRAGYVEFYYRLPKQRTLRLSLDALVQNEQCRAVGGRTGHWTTSGGTGGTDGGATDGSDASAGGDWRKRRIALQTGVNTISWTVTTSGMALPSDVVRIARIDFMGIAFTRSCSLCPAGTYSSAGSSDCKPCQPGTFSTRGSEQCGQCPQSQYSGPKASRCEDRPACRESDFYPAREPCSNGSTRVVYRPVTPDICRLDLPGAVQKPPPGPPIACGLCNAGFEPTSNGSCRICPKLSFTDGAHSCAPCPPDTVPVYGIELASWRELPSVVSTGCEYVSDEMSGAGDCDIGGPSWLATGDALVSAASWRRGIALLAIIQVDGFSSPRRQTPTSSSTRTAAVPVGQLTVVFDMHCAQSTCSLYIIEELPKILSFSRLLAQFNGTQSERRVFAHTIYSVTGRVFSLAFVRSGGLVGEDDVGDQVRVYSINITNALPGAHVAGTRCSKCARMSGDSSSGRCVACPNGHYLHKSTGNCVACPQDTFLNVSSTAEDSSACVPCGSGLHSSNGTECTITGQFQVPAATGNHTRLYDLTAYRNKPLEVQGMRVFGAGGLSYYHVMNISLFGEPVACKEQLPSDKLDLLMSEGEAVGAACRITVLSSPNRNGSARQDARYQPLLIATSLAAINRDKEWKEWKLDDKALDYDGTSESKRAEDVRLWFEASSQPTDACPRGSTLVVTLRCEPNSERKELRFPRGCPDGTCDGCLFHAFLENRDACWLCRHEDYSTVRGECSEQGRQRVHFIPSSHCVLAGAEIQLFEESCSSLAANLRFYLLVSGLLLLVLSSLLIMLCRRNSQIQYKYTRLVESTAGGELPQVETCALASDESDEEETSSTRVIFAKGRQKLFGAGRRVLPNNNNKRQQRGTDATGQPGAEDENAFVSLDSED